MDEDMMPLSMKMLHYQRYIKPHLRAEPNEQQTSLLMSEGWQAWRLGVRSEDLQNMLFVEWICEELQKESPQEFAELVSLLFEESHDSGMRIATAADLAYSSRVQKDRAEIFSSMMKEYKTLFESEFRLWATVPYLFAVRAHGKTTKGTTPDTFVKIGASQKYHKLKDVKIPVEKGHLANLAGTFETRIRNAGEGHDDWEITDEGDLHFRFTNPDSGAHQGEAHFTEQEFRTFVKAGARSVWVLKMGITLFLINNPTFTRQLKRIKPFKKKEIEGHMDSAAYDRWLSIPSFELDRENQTASLTLKRIVVRVKSFGGKIYLGTAGQFDVVQKELRGKYLHAALDVLKIMVGFLKDEEMPHLELKIFDEHDNMITDLTIEPDELRKLRGQANDANIPIPSRGEWPTAEYTRVIEYPVKPEDKDLWEEMMAKLPEEEVAFGKAVSDWNRRLKQFV